MEHIYEAHCHCGTVQITLGLPYRLGSAKYPVINCNCSVCCANGCLNVYPERKHLKISQGFENLQDYQPDSRSNIYKFCKTCGSSILIDLRHLELGNTDDPKNDTLAVNIRMVQGLDFGALKYKFEGCYLRELLYDGCRYDEEALASPIDTTSEHPQFSLAGNHLPITHKSAVIKDRSEGEPIWSLAKSLPHV